MDRETQKTIVAAFPELLARCTRGHSVVEAVAAVHGIPGYLLGLLSTAFLNAERWPVTEAMLREATGFSNSRLGAREPARGQDPAGSGAHREPSDDQMGPVLVAGALGFALLNVAYSGQTSVLMPLLVRDVLRGDAATFGAITAAFGAGAILAALMLTRIRITHAGSGSTCSSSRRLSRWSRWGSSRTSQACW